MARFLDQLSLVEMTIVFRFVWLRIGESNRRLLPDFLKTVFWKAAALKKHFKLAE